MICDTWKVPPAPAVENEPVTSAIPTLLLSGEFDPITPPSWATLAAETLERSFSYTYPGGGHGAIVDLDCAYEMAAEFLERPTAAPDDACLSDLGHTPSIPESALEHPRDSLHDGPYHHHGEHQKGDGHGHEGTEEEP